MKYKLFKIFLEREKYEKNTITFIITFGFYEFVCTAERLCDFKGYGRKW